VIVVESRSGKLAGGDDRRSAGGGAAGY
jgi:hypothetical protein